MSEILICLEEAKKECENLTFSQCIKKMRGSIGISLKRVSDKSQIPYQRLFRIERGLAKFIHIDEVEKLAEIFGFDKKMLLKKMQEETRSA